MTGAEGRERLVGVDDDRRRLVYSVIESPLGLSHHQASVEVLDGSDGGSAACRCGSATYCRIRAAPTIEEMMTLGAAAIARTLAG